MYERQVIWMKRQDGDNVVAGYRYAMPASTTDVRYVYFSGMSNIEDVRMFAALPVRTEKKFPTFCEMLADMLDLGKLGFRIIGETVWSE